MPLCILLGPPSLEVNMLAAKRKKETLERRPSRVSRADFLDKLITGHAADVMASLPEGSVDLIVTSPPYWTAVEYDQGENPWASYEAYLDDMQTVWNQCARVLRPNGKLCINSPI